MFGITCDEREYINYSEFLFKCILLNRSKNEKYRIRLEADSRENRVLIDTKTFTEFEELFKYVSRTETHDIIKKTTSWYHQKYWWVIDKVVVECGHEIPVMKCTLTTGCRIISRTIDDAFLCFYNEENVLNSYKLYQFLTHKSDELPGAAKVDKCKFYIGDIIRLESVAAEDPTYAVYLGELSKGKYYCVAKRASNTILDFTATYSLEEIEKFEKIDDSPYKTLTQIQELILHDPFYYYKWLLYYPAYKAFHIRMSSNTDHMEQIVSGDLKCYNEGKVYFR